MDIEIRPCRDEAELAQALNAIGHYFGRDFGLEDATRFARHLEVGRMQAAWEGDRCVGGAGAFSFRMSTPGGDVGAAGVTVVGVLPTHRRRGVLRRMIRAVLAQARERGEAAAYLFASEGTIYGRFGFGLASQAVAIELPVERTRFALPFEPRSTVRLLDEAEAAKAIPPLYERIRAQRPGMFARDRAWWEQRRLHDDPARRQGSPLIRALLELDGEPVGYALYKVEQSWAHGSSSGTLRVLEAAATSPEGERELWRWLLDFDWTSKIVADLLPPDHPLFLLLAEPRRLQAELADGVWVRLVDVEAALGARTFRDGEPVVLDVADGFLPENAGRYRVAGDRVARTDEPADLQLDVTGLGSVYLGGFSFADLVRGSRATELRPGAAARADDLFRTTAQPWCPEIF